MPHGEEVSFTPRVKLKGAPLEASLAGALVSGYVDQSLFSADLLLLRFRDPELGLLSSSRFAIGDPIEIGMEQSGPSGPRKAIKRWLPQLTQTAFSSGSLFVQRWQSRRPSERTRSTFVTSLQPSQTVWWAIL